MAISQDTRPLRLTFQDVDPALYQLTGFAGREAISEAFAFTLKVVAEVAAPLDFAKILGKGAVVEIDAGGQTRTVRGIVSRFSQGRKRDRFVEYSAELVPPAALLGNTERSTVFQQQSVPEILKTVVGAVAKLDLKGTYPPRNYCVQYRESDLGFAMRIMEEEGIYWFADPADEKGLAIVTNAAAPPRDLAPAKELRFDEGQDAGRDPVITEWTKSQTLHTGRIETTDHHFQLPHDPITASAKAPESVAVGTVTHDLTLGDRGGTGVVDHPLGVAHLRDGVDPGGGDRGGDIGTVFDEAARLAGIAMARMASSALTIAGEGTVPWMSPGFVMALANHFDADGDYLITAVEHAAALPGGETSDEDPFKYSNSFECLPAALPYCPELTIEAPYIPGTQTGVVVGTEGAEIEPDKFGRVKVWFRWDPQGGRQLETSCWVRVAQFWAGKQWGAQFIPRIGDEVVVAFENGDPDHPLVIGSVWNAENMPLYELPKHKTQSGIRTTSSPKGTTANYNEIKFEDKKGSELFSLHAERNMSTTVEADNSGSVGNNSTVTIGGDPDADPHTHGKSTTTIHGDTKVSITKGDYDFAVAEGKAKIYVKGPVEETFDDTLNTTVKNAVTFTSTAGDITIKAAGQLTAEAQKAVAIKSGTDAVTVTGQKEVKLVSGASSITLKADGTIEIKGVNVTVSGAKVDVNGSALTTIMGGMVKINC